MIKTHRFLPLFLLFVPLSARGEDAKPVVLSGDYYFYSAAQKDGRPLCSERWRFGPDGGMTIFSGQEVLAARFRLEVTYDDVQRSDYWLVRQALSTNGQPDCQGHKSSGVVAREERIYFYVAKAGDLVLCNIHGTGKDRILSLIGTVYRAPESDQPPADSAPRRD